MVGLRALVMVETLLGTCLALTWMENGSGTVTSALWMGLLLGYDLAQRLLGTWSEKKLVDVLDS